MKKLNQRGFHLAELGIVLIVMAMIGLVGAKVLTSNKNEDIKSVNDNSSTVQNKPKNQPKTTDITWQWNGAEWGVSAEAPACKDPVKFAVTPSDLTKANSVLYPGQVRGGNYKPHGGIGFENTTNSIAVKAIMDGKITSGSRYIESGEVQYLLWIQNDCGIAYRFDHLLTLSPTLQAVIDQLPAAKQDDSRTTNLSKPVGVKAGDTIATEIGFKNTKNVAYDLAVYDLRKPNANGTDPAYREAHKMELSQAAYALCWFDMFSTADSARLASLPSRDQANGKKSDYCK